MTRAFRQAIERQISKARADGAFDNLAGAGKPLPDRRAETGEDAALSAGLRLMAEAGVLPEEFSLQKQLDMARAAYQTLTDPSEKKEAMRLIADLELKTNIAREARKSFMR
jgi:hypothetical protein